MTIEPNPNDTAQIEPLHRIVGATGYSNPDPKERYDLVVLGAGTGGLVSAAAVSQLGASVALVEKNLMGGDCLVRGCVPSKAILHSAEQVRAYLSADASWEERATAWKRALGRMRRLREEIAHHDGHERFTELGVDVFFGTGRFVAADAVEVDGQRLRFRRAVVATGSSPFLPDFVGDDATVHTNETIFDLEELPRRLVVVGAGPIGCELGQAFARFGSEVTVVDRADRPLVRAAPEASAVVRRAMERDGVAFRFGHSVTAIRRGDDGASVVELDSEGDETTLSGDVVLVAIGRRPNTTGLGIDSAGLELDEGERIDTDSRLRTANRRVYAVGDCAVPQQFTHMAEETAKLVVRNAFFPGGSGVDDIAVAATTYTTPELAQVGNAMDARELGECDTWRAELSDVDRAILTDDRDGFAEIYTRRGSDEILGATIVARHAGELACQVTQAMKSGVGLGGLADFIYPYPTAAMLLKAVALEYQRARLNPVTRSLLAKWFAFWRFFN